MIYQYIYISIISFLRIIQTWYTGWDGGWISHPIVHRCQWCQVLRPAPLQPAMRRSGIDDMNGFDGGDDVGAVLVLVLVLVVVVVVTVLMMLLLFLLLLMMMMMMLFLLLMMLLMMMVNFQHFALQAKMMFCMLNYDQRWLGRQCYDERLFQAFAHGRAIKGAWLGQESPDRFLSCGWNVVEIVQTSALHIS